jgi:hypothetical protein
MTAHRYGSALLALGLSLTLGCGGNVSGFRQNRGNQGCRRDATFDRPVQHVADRPADILLSPDVSLSADGPYDGSPPDSDPDQVLDAFALDAAPLDDSEGDAGESADACVDDATIDGGRACGRSPWILVGEVPNVRQLGGLPLVDGGKVACDLVYRGSSLSSLTPSGCDQFAATGIKTVIDIRSESEQTSPPSACVTERAQLVSAPLPTPYNTSPADYLADLYTAPSMRRVFAILADRAAYPVYYHCLYGKDRTGVLTAVILTALGVSRRTIQEEYAMSAEAGFAIYPASLNAVLDELERIGVDTYFRVVGVPPEQVQAMRDILKGTRPAI